MSDLNIPEDAVMAAAGEVEYYGVDRADRDRAAREALEAAARFVVAAELERLAEALPNGEQWSADYEAGRYDVRQVVLNRAAELRSGVSGTGDQQ